MWIPFAGGTAAHIAVHLLPVPPDPPSLLDPMGKKKFPNGKIKGDWAYENRYKLVIHCQYYAVR